MQSALTVSKSSLNKVFNAQASVLAGDVTFPTPIRVRVVVQRSAVRGNPVSLFLGPMIGLNTANVGAVATAEASPANAETCVKPFTIPDRWLEKAGPVMDAGLVIRHR